MFRVRVDFALNIIKTKQDIKSQSMTRKSERTQRRHQDLIKKHISNQFESSWATTLNQVHLTCFLSRQMIGIKNTRYLLIEFQSWYWTGLWANRKMKKKRLQNSYAQHVIEGKRRSSCKRKYYLMEYTNLSQEPLSNWSWCNDVG